MSGDVARSSTGPGAAQARTAREGPFSPPCHGERHWTASEENPPNGARQGTLNRVHVATRGRIPRRLGRNTETIPSKYDGSDLSRPRRPPRLRDSARRVVWRRPHARAFDAPGTLLARKHLRRLRRPGGACEELALPWPRSPPRTRRALRAALRRSLGATSSPYSFQVGAKPLARTARIEREVIGCNETAGAYHAAWAAARCHCL